MPGTWNSYPGGGLIYTTRAHSCPAQHCWTYFQNLAAVLGAGSACVGPRGQARENEDLLHAPFSRAACHRMGLGPSITFKILQKCGPNIVVFIILRRSWHWHSVQATASSSAPPALLTMPSLTQGELRGNLNVCRTSVSLWTPAASLNNDSLLIQHRSPFVTR